jgi:hypothetical protein
VTPAPAAVPSVPVVDAGSSDDAVARVTVLASWTSCPVWRSLELGSPVTRHDVEVAVQASGITSGRIDIPDSFGRSRTVWLGGDAQEAVTGLGGAFIVRDTDTVWTVVREAGRDVAIRLEVAARRDGGTFWQVRGRAEPAPYCAGTETAPTGPVAVRHVSGRGLEALLADAGLGACRTWQRHLVPFLPDVDLLERAAGIAGVARGGSGWAKVPWGNGYGAPMVMTWFGDDEAEAVRRHGSTLAVIDDSVPGSVWLRESIDGRPLAVELRIADTPGGRRAWLATENAAGTLGGCDASG